MLKDASAAAIYGSRASNGVILVTTKKGRGNTPRVSYSGSVSVQTNSDELPVMSPGEFRTYIDQVYPAGTTTGDKVQSMLGDKNTNWQDLVFRTAISHDHNVSLIGNINDRMPYRASVGYTNQQGTLETSKYERGTLDLSLSPNFFDKHLTVNLNAKGVVTSQRYASGGVVGSAAFFNPNDRPLLPQRRRLDRLHDHQRILELRIGPRRGLHAQHPAGCGPALAALRPRQYGACQAFHRQRPDRL